MSRYTKIPWADSTVNPMAGCEGCELWTPRDGGIGTCYAARQVNAYRNKPGFPSRFDRIEFYPARMGQALKYNDLAGKTRTKKPWLEKRRRIIFLCDMGDLFCTQVPYAWIKSVIHDNVTSDDGRKHDWIVCTKRATRMLDYDQYLEQQGIEWPDNLWTMVTVTKPETVRRCVSLVQMRSRVKAVNVEPLLERVYLTGFLTPSTFTNMYPHVNWVLCGQESGPGNRLCSHDDIRVLRDHCSKYNIPFFLKQLCNDTGEKEHVPMFDGQQYTEMPKP